MYYFSKYKLISLHIKALILSKSYNVKTEQYSWKNKLNEFISEKKPIKNIAPFLSDIGLLTFSFIQVLNNPQTLFFDINMQQKHFFFIIKKLSHNIKNNSSYQTRSSLNVYVYNNSYLLERLIIKQAIINLLNEIYNNVVVYLPKSFQPTKDISKVCPLIVEHRNHTKNKFIIINYKLKTFPSLSNAPLFLQKYIVDKHFYRVLDDILYKTKKFNYLFASSLKNILLKFCFYQVDVFIYKWYNQVKPIFYLKKKIFALVEMLLKLFVTHNKKMYLTKPVFFKYSKRITTSFYFRHFNQLLLFFNHSSSFMTQFNKQFFFFLKKLKLTSSSKIINKSEELVFNGFLFKNILINHEKQLLFVSTKIFQVVLLKYNIINKSNKPTANLSLQHLRSNNIIAWYSYFIKGILFHYKIVDNYIRFKRILIYYCRWSLLLTLAKKHRKAINILLLKFHTFRNLNQKVLFTTKITTTSYIYKYVKL